MRGTENETVDVYFESFGPRKESCAGHIIKEEREEGRS
jgi:hypothetical protein